MEVLDQTQKTEISAADPLAGSQASTSSMGRSKGRSFGESDMMAALNATSLDSDSSRSSSSKSGSNSELEAQPKTEKMGTCQFAGTPLCTCNMTKSGSADGDPSGMTDASYSGSSSAGSSHGGSTPDDHNHAPDVSGNKSTHFDLAGVSTVNIDASQVEMSSSKKLLGRLLSGGDFLDGGAGNDVVIDGGRGSVIFGDKGGINTITTGGGRDAVILGRETTNRVFDFNPERDKLILAEGLTMNDISIVQGTNPGKGGVNQPIDGKDNALVVDKASGHILASLTFTSASSLTAESFAGISTADLDAFRNDARTETGVNVQRGDGQLNATRGRDKLVAGGGNDFLRVGDDGFRFKTARGIDEFPFPTDSPGTTRVNVDLKGNVMNINGTWKGFDGLPLFSQGEKEIDPKAKILNGSNPQALVEGFLRVPQDVEGNPISGTHLHFSPAGDKRGNFADATVIRFLENTPNADKKSGTIKGQFELAPEEQAALLAGNMYINLHTNIDGDGDGRAGFPTGENRINLNKNVVQFT